MGLLKNDDGWRLPDEIWGQMEPLLPPRKPHPRGGHNPRVSDRAAMDAILFVLRTGCQWNALNATGICSSSSAHRRFQEWTQAGVFEEFWRLGLLALDALDGIPFLALLAMAKAALAIALIYLVGGRVVHPLFRAFARHRQPDVFMALILLSTFGIAGLSLMAGLSMALGALIAGLLLAETEFKHEVELMVEPFKGLLMGLFFMTVGMGMDPLQILHAPLWLACAVALLVLIKGAVLAPLLRLGGLPWGRAVEGALLLGQGGEFAFIVIGYAIGSRLLAPGLGGRVMLAVGLSLFLTPLLARIGSAIGERAESQAREQEAHQMDASLEAARGHVIIAGFGRVGQQLAKLLASQNIPYVAFENDAKLVSKLHAEGVPVYFECVASGAAATRACR
jgi:CPA2 family monovalent cation:H+ antiporter-2